jgi:spermidine synthase
VTAASSLPEVNFSDFQDIRYLHLGTEWVQGSMRLDEPFEIHLEYVQRMMAWLLFVEPSGVAKRHAMQLGLGAGSLTKFCHRKLRMKTTAIELNPQVVAACRLWFKLPRDDSRLSVVLGDAAEVASHAHWRGEVDALQVDLYDHEAAAPVLPQAVDRRRSDDGQPVRTLVQLRAQPGAHRRGFRRRCGLGVPAHARRQHRRPRAAHPATACPW